MRLRDALAAAEEPIEGAPAAESAALRRYDARVEADNFLAACFTDEAAATVRPKLHALVNALVDRPRLLQKVLDGFRRPEGGPAGILLGTVFRADTTVEDVLHAAAETPELSEGAESLARQQQVGGSHYLDMAIPPRDYIRANALGWDEGNVIKYVSRWRRKNGVEDLRKARHYLDMLIESAEREAPGG